MTSTTAELIRVGRLEVRFLVDDVASAGTATVFEITVPAGANVPPPHSHDGFEETVYGLRGTLRFTIDGETREIAPGEALVIRRGQIHRFENPTDDTAAFLSVATPGVFLPAYFHEVAELLTAAAGGPPDIAAMSEVMRRHGLTLAAPPPAA